MSAGRGPSECAWAVASLARRLETTGARQGLSIRRLESVPGPRSATFLSVLFDITGSGAAEFVASWTGTLCWQAPSPYRTVGRKNWYVVSAPCAVDAPVTRFAAADVEVVAIRTGGPGGQHRNKASTAVRATHRPSGIVVVVDTERQFTQNRRLALARLRQRLERGDEAARPHRCHRTLAHPRRTRPRQPHPRRTAGLSARIRGLPETRMDLGWRP